MADILFTKKLFGSLPSGGSGSPSSYTSLTSKPQINGVTLSGNKTTADLNIPSNYTLSGLNITSTNVASKALIQAVAAKNLPSGAFVTGGVSLTDFPSQSLSNAEIQISIKDSTIAGVKVYDVTLSSLDVAPYIWYTAYRTDQTSAPITWVTPSGDGANKDLSNLSATGEAHFVKPTDKATTNAYGVVKADGTTITVNNGVISSSAQKVFQVGTLPQASLAEYTNRNIYQYKGDSVEGGYTFGYFYHCAGGPESFTATQTVGTSVGTITTDVNEFKVAIGASLASRDYIFKATGTIGQPASGWMLDDVVITDITDYGVYYSGIAITGTTIKATYAAESYSWEQLNVQPGGGFSRTTVTDTTSTTASISVNAGTDYIYTQSLTSLSVTGTSGNMMNEATITFTTGNNPSVNIDQSITRMGGQVTFESNKTYIISFWNGFYIVGVEGA